MDKKQLKDKFLLVDMGNSSVKWGALSGQAQMTMLREYYPEDISDIFFKGLWEKEIKPHKVIVSSVAHELVWHAIETACMELWDIKPEKVSSPTQGQGVINAYLHASDLGSDRWCAIVAAHRQAENSACVVVDCGTAITIDVVDAAGQHLGGYILPGLQMMQRNLGVQTAKINLDKANTADVPLIPADSTTGCVLSGSRLAAVAAIEAVVMAEEKKYGRVKSCITGGDAIIISTLLSVEHSVIPELVLQGLALIAADAVVN